MNRNLTVGRLALPLALIVIFNLLTGCNLPASSGGVTVWLDVPLDGLTFPDVQAIKIEGHAASTGGIGRVEIWINGVMLTSIVNPPMQGNLAAFHAEWTPSAPGAYTIQAIAFDGGGNASSPDSARVTFGAPTPVVGCPSLVGGGPTPLSCVTPLPPPVVADTVTPTPLPVVADTVTPPPPAAALIQFWAEPPNVTAGACTTIRWHVENASRVVFGGVDQPFDGSYQDCLCASQRYTLTVTRLDGIGEKRTVDVGVTGSCVTPTLPPPSDTMPPPAPTPAVPADGLTIACKGSQNLVWLPVSDPSGIAEYRVQAQRHSGDNHWRDIPGSVFTGIQGKQLGINVECGWYYRWRVRAIDGAGNAGGWSDWWLFAITLG